MNVKKYEPVHLNVSAHTFLEPIVRWQERTIFDRVIVTPTTGG